MLGFDDVAVNAICLIFVFVFVVFCCSIIFGLVCGIRAVLVEDDEVVSVLLVLVGDCALFCLLCFVGENM